MNWIANPLCYVLSLSLVLALAASCVKKNQFQIEMAQTEDSLQDVPPPSEAVLRDVIPLWESKVTAGKDWTAHVHRELESLGASLLSTVPDDAAVFCPNYVGLSQSQRIQYWTFLLSSMVQFESGFDTNSALTENFNDTSGQRVVSRGLLQISLESGNLYSCGLTSGDELHDAFKNLSCGIRILNHWMVQDHRIAGRLGTAWRGGARYWAVLRSTNTTPYNSIVSWNKNLSICK
jgi:hypothetical protein